MRTIDVAIIGAGSAGIAARSEVARVTDDYLVIDHGTLGTTCARVGCMPSKAFIQVANDFHRRHVLEEMGVVGADGLSVDRGKVMAHVRRLRDAFVGWRTGQLKVGSTTRSERTAKWNRLLRIESEEPGATFAGTAVLAPLTDH